MENLQPKLRFPEFEEKWIDKLLGEVIEIKGRIGYRGYTVNDIVNKDEGALAMSPSNISENGKLKFINNTFISWYKYDESPEIQLERGYTILVKTGSSYGKSAFIENLNFKATINPQLVVLKPLNIHQKFLSIIISHEYIQKQIAQKIVGGTIPTLSQESISKFKISLPPIIEQTKIADFLGAVDKQLELLTTKKEKLHLYKKGVMQKLFSQEIRFTKEDGTNYPDWEETKIGDVCDIKRGASPRPINNPKWFSEDSTVGWVRISDVTKSKNILNSTTQYLSNEGILKSRLVTKGNLIMSICATIGKPIYTGFDVCIHDGFVVFDNLKCIHQYLFYYLDSIQDRWHKYGQPGTQINLNSTIVSNEYFPLPKSTEEQSKIADFLTAIDNQIDAIDNQIIKTENYKKGLLQQMFV